VMKIISYKEASCCRYEERKIWHSITYLTSIGGTSGDFYGLCQAGVSFVS